METNSVSIQSIICHHCIVILQIYSTFSILYMQDDVVRSRSFCFRNKAFRYEIIYLMHHIRKRLAYIGTFAILVLVDCKFLNLARAYLGTVNSVYCNDLSNHYVGSCPIKSIPRFLSNQVWVYLSLHITPDFLC